MQAPSEIQVPKIDAKEGGKISGYGERFEVNLVSGSASFTMPVAAPKLREIAPDLSLSYSGSVGNSPYGLGFDLALPAISRLTDRGIPRYTSDDRFVFDGGELTPRYDPVGSDWVKSERVEGDYLVIGFRARIEGSGTLVEWWQNQTDGTSYWRTVSAENLTARYGVTAEARIADPQYPTRIYSWLISDSCDALGNKIIYDYKREDGAGLPAGANCAQSYVSAIRYGNYLDGTTERFAVNILFDYGEYSPPSIDPAAPWRLRSDPFSTYRPGFELRTWRLCRNILTVHDLPSLPGAGRCLSNVLALDYDETPYFSIPTSVQQIGWKTLSDGSQVSEAKPQVTLSFNAFSAANSQMQTLEVSGLPPFQGPPGRGQYQFVDLYGDGIPGMLFNDASTIAYWRALGEGRYQPPIAPAQLPIDRALAEGHCALMDLDGNGQLDLVVRDPSRAGFYRNNNNGSWESFVPFSSVPPEIAMPGMEFVDLDGGGRQDLMIGAGRERIRVYSSLGTGGYAAPTLHGVPELFPPATGESPVTFIGFANVFGDGLQHRIRLSDGLLTVWPTLGYGDFGAPVTISNTPRFGAGLTTARIFFADVTGSGYADLIYAYDDYLAIYRNESGNRFSDPLLVPVPQRIDDLDQINFADVFGDGRAAFVLSKAAAPVSHHALRFPATEAPFHLSVIDNGFGGTTALTYRSSTHFQLADRKAGRPWPTPLSTVVQLVEQTQISDGATGLTSTTHYQYADGYYDPIEREFRGFAYAQSLDSQAISPTLWHFPSRGGQTFVPGEPCLSRRWNNTGAATLVDARSVPLPRFRGDPLVPDDYLDPDIFVAGGATVREAYRALKEREAAKSTTGLDTSGEERPVAYQSTAQNYRVRMLQPRIGPHPASFQVTQRQSRVLSEEDNPAEARVADSFNLEQDAFGNITLIANIAYPRPIGPDVAPQQLALITTATARAYINHPATTAEPYRYVGLQWQETELDIGGLTAGSGFFNFDTLSIAYAQALADTIDYGTPFTPGQMQARPYHWTRDLYWNAMQSAPLPFGSLSAQSLIYEQQKAVFPPSFVATIYGARVDDAMLEASGGRGAGYILADGYWWNPGSRRHYADATQFYLPIAVADPYGARTQFSYDTYALEMIASTDALGQVTQFATDYQALQPYLVTDINGNCTETFYSPLAEMLAFSRYGTIGGVSLGDAPLTNYQYIAPKSRADILADPEKYLQGAGSYYWEDYFSMARGDGPVCSVLIDADRAIKPADPKWDPGPRRYGATLSYIDAQARDLAKQSKIEAAALDAGAAGDSWIVTDQLAYDEQGREARRYAPYVSALPVLDLSPNAPCTSSFHDALGRVIRTDTPPGFFSKTIYRTWAREVWDEDDTILDSSYYQANIGNTDPAFANERNALLKAAQFAGTFATIDLDPLGRDCVETKQVTYAPVGTTPPAPELIQTGSWYDSAGSLAKQADPRFYKGAATVLFNVEQAYAMTGEIISTVSTDCGKAQPGTGRVLTDSLGNPLDRWDNASQHVRHAYDTLRRPTGLFVDPVTGTPYQAESLVYGTDPTTNSRNRIVIRRDQAEEARIALYDLTDQPTAETRQFPVEYDAPIDWSDPSKVPMLPKIWDLGAVFNRRSWALAQFNADGTVTATSYYVNGWIATSALAPDASQPAVPVMGARRYFANAQPTDSVFANGTTTSRGYDAQTQRLNAIRTLRTSDSAVLQDDDFYYDAVGNVTRIVRKAEPPSFWRNGVTTPDNDYTYDSIYRLRLATGRQEADLTAPGAQRFAGAADDQLVPYTESYTLDPSNNLLQVRHVAAGSGGQGSWTWDFAVSATSNHAVPADMATGGKVPDDFYDLNGNLAQLPNLPAIAFDYRRQMSKAALVIRPGSSDDAEYYRYDRNGARRRKTKRFLQSSAVTIVEDVFYIGALVHTTRTRLTGGGSTPDGEASSLSVGAGDERLLIIDTDSTQPTPQLRYQVANNQSSVTIELDASGLLITFEEYLPYGGKALAKGKSQLDLDRKRYRYVGRELDSATGLYCIGLRYYVPSMGRFLTTDPAGYKDGLNLYAYTGCNPTTFVDRTGTARLTGQAALVQQRQARMDADFHRAVDMVEDAIALLEAQIATRNGWWNSTFWSRGTINNPDPLIQQYFGIAGTTRTDANNLFEVLDNFRAIRAYFARPPVQSRLSWRYAQSFFVHIPQFNVRPDPPRNTTIAFVQGGSVSWPDWRILPQSVRARPLGPLTGLGLITPLARGLIRMTPYAGINLYDRLHFAQSGPNTRASTLVHEATHLIFYSEDYAYGDEPEFRTLSTQQRMYNADSYGLFAQAVYERDHH
ncbi:SpvB/TcaC N-terminal domain-containing protein [Bosea sp. NPDC055332]